MNAFEQGRRKSIPATLIYGRCGDHFLMVHRDRPGGRDGDYHSGKWNGLGGKCEPDESPLDAARREFHEESGIELPKESFRALGVLTFPNFKAHKDEDWICFVFLADIPESWLARELKCPEGALHWVSAKDIAGLNLWPGDRYFIQKVVDGKPFVGTIWYEGQDVKGHWIQEF